MKALWCYSYLVCFFFFGGGGGGGGGGWCESVWSVV